MTLKLAMRFGVFSWLWMSGHLLMVFVVVGDDLQQPFCGAELPGFFFPLHASHLPQMGFPQAPMANWSEKLKGPVWMLNDLRWESH